MVGTSKRIRVGLAISGGPDSMGMTAYVLANGLSAQFDFHALIVDHALRDGSGPEAEKVATSLAQVGISASILRWDRPTGFALNGKLRAARWARYALLADAARRLGLERIWVAHTIEDQIETVQMRLGGGSSLRGLSGLSARYRLFDTLFERPTLGMEHPVLATQAEELFGQDAIVIDPTNRNPQTWRGRHRQALGRGGATVDPQALLNAAQEIGQWRNRFEHSAHGVADPTLFLAEQLQAEPFASAARLCHQSQYLTQREWPMGFDRALTLVQDMHIQSQPGRSRGRLTLSGTVLVPCNAHDEKAWRLGVEADSRAHGQNANAPNRFWQRLFQDASVLSHSHAISPNPEPFAIARPGFVTTLHNTQGSG